MKTSTRTIDSNNATENFFPVFIFINVTKGDQTLRTTMFVAASLDLKEVWDICRNKNADFRNKVREMLIDQDGDFLVLFDDKLKVEPQGILDPEISELYFEYGDIIQNFLGSYDAASLIWENQGCEKMCIDIFIDVADNSKTEIVGTIHESENKKDFVFFQIN
jgi:hypothetical protein